MDLLAAAVAPLPDRYRERSAFNPLLEASLVSQLADQSFDSGRKKQAIDALEAAANRLQDRGADYAVEPLHRHSKNLKRRKS